MEAAVYEQARWLFDEGFYAQLWVGRAEETARLLPGEASVSSCGVWSVWPRSRRGDSHGENRPLRIVLAASPVAADAWVKCFLAAVCGVEWVTTGEGPAGADLGAFATWIGHGGFRDGTAIQRHFPYTRELADLAAGVPASLVTVVRDPYDVFVALYRSVQERAPGEQSTTRRPVDAMAGNPLTDPAVLAYLENGFRPYLAQMAGWLDDARVTMLRYEDLRRDPVGSLGAARVPLVSAREERVAQAAERCTAAERRAKLTTNGGSPLAVGLGREILTDVHFSLFRARHADLIEVLGYEIVESGADDEGRARGCGGDGPLWPLDSIRWGNAVPGGRQHFVEIGRASARDVIEACALRPDERVLEVGSGGGRVAIALTEYLSRHGSYEGFDIDREAVQWCQERITAHFPNFKFRWADLYNAHYNPNATVRAAEYRFPYPDASFDVCFLASVFTHMLPDDVGHYLCEIARVLRPGGRCLMTAFLLNAETRELLRQGRCRRAFAHDRGVYRLERDDIPEAAVAYDEEVLRRWIEAAGLVIEAPIYYAPWCGRNGAPPGPGQDYLVATRPA